MVHLKFAELWLGQPGQRPMDIEINGRIIWKRWDPAAAANRIGRAAEIRAEDVTPDRDGKVAQAVMLDGVSMPKGPVTLKPGKHGIVARYG